jgi:hypothetical protein
VRPKWPPRPAPKALALPNLRALRRIVRTFFVRTKKKALGVSAKCLTLQGVW